MFCVQEHFGKLGVDKFRSFSDASFKDVYLTFVDDLLLLQLKHSSSEGTAVGGTLLEGMAPNSACLAALLFLS